MTWLGAFDLPLSGTLNAKQIVLPPTVAIGTHPKQPWSRHLRRAALGILHHPDDHGL